MSSLPTVVLVHGAFADSSSWNGVIDRLQQHGVPVVAVANPLRSLSGDARYVIDVLDSISGPVVLVGHSYGGSVITQAAAGSRRVVALVFVAAFAPDTGETALALTGQFAGSTLGDAITEYPTAAGVEIAIVPARFAAQFAADVDPAEAAAMSVTQRPVLQAALTEGLPTGDPAWRDTPSWFILAEADRNIPAAAIRWMADRASARELVEVPGASHAVAVSHPEEVADTILTAWYAEAVLPA